MRSISTKFMRKTWIAIYRYAILFQKLYNIQTLRHKFWNIFQHSLSSPVLNFLCKAGRPHSYDSWRERKYMFIKHVLWASLLANCVICVVSSSFYNHARNELRQWENKTPFFHTRWRRLVNQESAKQKNCLFLFHWHYLRIYFTFFKGHYILLYWCMAIVSTMTNIHRSTMLLNLAQDFQRNFAFVLFRNART